MAVAIGMNRDTDKPYYGLLELSENSAIFVAPDGLDKGWANTNGRDVAFTDAFLEQVQNDLCIDTTRIFATGFSYGAGMSYAVACARPTVFRGGAVYAAALLSGCQGGTTPVAYFGAHGINDATLNYSGGENLRNKFVTLNRCVSQNPPRAPRGGHICTSFDGCMPEFPVRWCSYDGGHNPTHKDSGTRESWVPEEAWNFIAQF
ncbi:alpha/beta hydrolase family esterase [Sorangium atrum]|uniref:Feruloyl esterase n=1 Tax=Sorangium atrum TaxID=2995308 RepID=A0ABT5C9A8_9BACT|nr:hypothetical protein [Sorangium aterium]MDC0683026.1 hypothetical protein [Sorangium aterium]